MLNQRTLIDVNLSQTVAAPAQNTNVSSGVIDLVTITAGRVPNVELGITSSAAFASLADGQTITVQVQDSADGATGWAAVADLPSYVSTGAGGVGAAAVAVQVKLPINLRRYIKVVVTASATAGNNTAVSITLFLAF